MRYLGAGACSAVFSLSKEEAEAVISMSLRQGFEQDGVIPYQPQGQLALRVSRTFVPVCPTCERALEDFIGFRYDIPLTDELRHYCASVCPLLADRCKVAGHACFIPDFAVDPAFLMFGKGSARSLAVEIKPKGMWKHPRVVGIAVDGVDYYLHPVKLRQCRFSLMQLLKSERRNERGVVMPCGTDSIYCPNQLLVGDQPSIVQGMRNLIRCPRNNLRLISGETILGEFSEADLDLLSTALHTSGVFDILTNLQLYGKSTVSDWEVLDIELLFYWSLVRDASSVRWIVRDTCASASSNLRCACQSGDNRSWRGAERRDDGSTSRIVPPMSIEDCLDRFYTSTTAKDVSVLVALSDGVGVTEIVAKSPTMKGGCAEGVRWNSSYGGVCVNFRFPTASICRIGVVDVDSKRHKSLSHYFALDREVLMSWERWKELRVPTSP